MKVSKPEIQNQMSTLDASTTQTPTSPDDLIYSLIAEMTALNTDISKTPESIDTNSTTLSNSSTIDSQYTQETKDAIKQNNDLVLSQLNLASEMIKPEEAKTSNAAPEKIIPNNTQEILESADFFKTMQSSIQPKPKLSTDTTSQNESVKPVPSLISDTFINSTTTNENPITNEDVTQNQISNAITNTFNSAQEAMKKPIDAITSLPTTKIDKEINVTPDLSVADPFTQIISPAEIKKPEVKNIFSTPAPENKYTDALVQLGNFINVQTAQIVPQNTGINLSLSPQIQQTIPKTPTKIISQPELETKIELLPPSIDTQMKEVYNAKIKIYPPELGHVEAKLKIEKNSAELIIFTENTRVKEIVETHMSELRENFQKADIPLTQVQVQVSLSNQKDQQQQNSRNNEPSNPQSHQNDPNQPKLSTKDTQKSSNTLVDTYA